MRARQIIDQFLEGGYEFVSVAVKERDPNYMRIVLSELSAEKVLGEEAKAYVVSNTLYLERDWSSEK